MTNDRQYVVAHGVEPETFNQFSFSTYEEAWELLADIKTMDSLYHNYTIYERYKGVLHAKRTP